MTRDLEHVRWACFLGADTARRLATEWAITRRRAGFMLSRATQLGRLRRVRRGKYLAITPREAA